MSRRKIDRNLWYDATKKRYYIMLDYGKDSQGKRIREQPSFKTEKEARGVLKEFKAEKCIREKYHVAPCKETLSEYAAYHMACLRAERKSKTTLAGYENILRHLNRHKIAKMRLDEIQTKHVNKYKLDIRCDTRDGKELSNKTINKHLALLKSIFNRAIEEDMLIKNPVTKRTMLEGEKEEVMYYTKSQCIDLLERLRGTTIEVPIVLALFTGMRRGEVQGLRWDNVDLGRRIINIKENRVRAGRETYIKGPKSKRSKRRVYISDYLLEILTREKQKQAEHKELMGNAYCDNGYVYCKLDGSLYSVDHVSKQFSKFLKKNDLEHIKYHALRHTFISLLAQEGSVNTIQLQRVAGHSSVATTEAVYSHLNDDGNKCAIETFSNILKTH